MPKILANLSLRQRISILTVAILVGGGIFALVQWVGSKRQAQLMEWMTYGAIAALVWFWIACIPGVRLERIFTEPLLTDGWSGVLKAIQNLMNR